MTNTFARQDTLLGVCEALGEDLGFNPLWLRIALTGGMLWNPVAMIGGYLAAGVMIAIVRRLTPAGAKLATRAPGPLGVNDDVAAPAALAA
jgi:phage shock protein C